MRRRARSGVPFLATAVGLVVGGLILAAVRPPSGRPRAPPELPEPLAGPITLGVDLSQAVLTGLNVIGAVAIVVGVAMVAWWWVWWRGTRR